MHARGTNIDTMLACQPWRFAYKLPDALITHHLHDKQDCSPF